MTITSAAPATPSVVTPFALLKQEAVAAFSVQQPLLHAVTDNDYARLLQCLDSVFSVVSLPSEVGDTLFELRRRVRVASFDHQRIIR